MALHPEPPASIVCAENIALSSLFHSIPVAPTRNGPSSLPPPKANYTLPFDTERRLAGTLAFLAQSKDDVDHIPAVCLEETEAGTLNVIVAVNKATHTNGEGALLRIEKGFESIFAVLAGGFVGSDQSQSEGLEEKVLREIVAMCSPRILCRLRLASSRKNVAFQDTLRNAMLAVRGMGRQKLAERDLVETAEDFEKGAKEVNKLIGAWSRYQVNANLEKIVKGVHQLQQIAQLPALIRMITNQAMDPDLRASLMNIIGKVSRYRDAARLLYRSAKKFPLARTMKTVSVRLPGKAFEMPPGLMNEYVPDLCSKLVEACPQGKAKSKQDKLLTDICAVLKTPEQSAIKQYSKQVKRTLKEGKIHAEVQLVAYCELERPTIYPRVICSSKDACFLCNMFLREYGKIYTPQTHGRLYPGWRLPWLPQLAEVERRFCQAIGDQCKQSCAGLLATGKRVALSCPNESTLFTLPLSSTTVAIESESEVLDTLETKADSTKANTASAGLAPEHDELEDSNGVHSEIFTPRTCNQSPSESAPAGSDHADNSTVAAESIVDDGARTITVPLDCLTTEHRHLQHGAQLHKISEYLTLDQNLEVNGDLAPGTSSDLYRAGPLEIEIEHATGIRHIAYRLRYLNMEEAARIQARENDSHRTSDPVVEAENLDPGSAGAVTFSGRNSLCLTARGAVLEIAWTAHCLAEDPVPD
ncbi:hypothetical protein BDW74DRAFT_148753 [Aspergillus multicolor]|uniref:nucleic acid/nucleotide deaminase domain-containing protein n=1 Tax=Aspergillus multicolor TaxID=41759 RepID=UPI003CCD14D0